MKDIRELIRHAREARTQREMADAVGVTRNTIAGYLPWLREQGWLEKGSELPSDEEIRLALQARYANTRQSVSVLHEHAETIKQWREAGLSIRLVQQRLRSAKGVHISYQPVWHYVREQERASGQDVAIRIESEPGEEGQVDFGYGGLMYDPQAQRQRKSWAFVMTLSWSRHQYVQFVFEQSVGMWVDCHRRAFEYFGGVPKQIKLDNLKAAIVKASVDDPQVQRSYRECAEHYGFLISPCRVATPQHKGKVESGVKYVKNNFLPGRSYKTATQDVRDAQREVLEWIEQTAGTRTHGTTKEQPLARFAHEQSSLQALPANRYDVAEWSQAKLHRDSHIVFKASSYSAPYKYIGQMMDVRATATQVTLYAAQVCVAQHTRATAPGGRKTSPLHYPPERMQAIQSSSEVSARAHAIGPNLKAAVDGLLADPVVDRRHSARRLVQLADVHTPAVLEHACQLASEVGELSPFTIRNMLKLHGHALPTAAPALTAPQFARSANELLGISQAANTPC